MEIRNYKELKREVELWTRLLMFHMDLKPKGKTLDYGKPEKKKRSNKNVILDCFYYKAYALLDRIPPKRDMITNEEAALIGEHLEEIFDEMVAERFSIHSLIPESKAFSVIVKEYKQYWKRDA